MSSKPKYWSGQECQKTARYGQYSDVNDAYAGALYDRDVQRGDRFPPSLNNHHFQEK
jgi:hypothetical protein